MARCFQSFDCNICLESSQKPVITLCGHLYCWSCICRWLEIQNDFPASSRCPVCKASISDATLIPLYGCGNSSRLACPSVADILSFTSSTSTQTPCRGRGNYSASVDIEERAEITRVGEMVYAWMFEDAHDASMKFYPNSYYQLGRNGISTRDKSTLLRQERKAERCLDRITIFLFCCFIFCLIVF